MERPTAAARQPQQQSPSFFMFLKHGAVLPAQDVALFALLLGPTIAVQPLAAAQLLDAHAIGRTDPANAAYRDLDYSLLQDALPVLLASLFLVYLAVVCRVGVVVSSTEPGRRGAGAVSRPWRLMQGRGAQAVLYVVATCALGAAASPVYTLALSWWPWTAVAGVAYVLLLGAVEVFSTAAVTAYYFECRESVLEAEEMGHDGLLCGL